MHSSSNCLPAVRPTKLGIAGVMISSVACIVLFHFDLAMFQTIAYVFDNHFAWLVAVETGFAIFGKSFFLLVGWRLYCCDFCCGFVVGLEFKFLLCLHTVDIFFCQVLQLVE